MSVENTVSYLKRLGISKMRRGIVSFATMHICHPTARADGMYFWSRTALKTIGDGSLKPAPLATLQEITVF